MANPDIFHRIFNLYHITAANILRAAAQGPLSKTDLNSITEKYNLAASFKKNLSGSLALLLCNADNQYEANIAPFQRPQTIFEKNWLYTISQDPRAKLFDIDIPENHKQSLLYDYDIWVDYDKFQDGDNYQDQTYIQTFKTIISAIKEKRFISFNYCGNNMNKTIFVNKIIPLKLEYSPKNDKFRLLAITNNCFGIYNLSNIQGNCKLEENITSVQLKQAKTLKPTKKTTILEIIDTRNTMQRALLAFADYEKTVEFIGKQTSSPSCQREQQRLIAENKHVCSDFDSYKLTLHYIPADEKELVIRILSMGHLVKVVEGDSIIQEIKKRIRLQVQLFQKLQSKIEEGKKVI